MIVRKLLYDFNNNSELLRMSIKSKEIFNIIVSILAMIVSNIQMIDIMHVSGIKNYRIILYNIIICLVIIYINIYAIKNKKSSKSAEYKLSMVEEKNENLMDIVDRMRSFKHDFNNIIQALDGYIFLEDIKALAIYFKSLLKECNYVNCIDRLNAKDIGNPAIYGILVNKYKIAEEKNIQMNIDILDNLNRLDEKSYVISRMVGILMDNALEASQESEEKIINVQFLKGDTENKKVIIIENSYNNKDVDTTKIFEKNYTTKKEQGNSGLGLWKIKDIVSKDPSFKLYTTKDELMFRQRLEIYYNN